MAKPTKIIIPVVFPRAVFNSAAEDVQQILADSGVKISTKSILQRKGFREAVLKFATLS